MYWTRILALLALLLTVSAVPALAEESDCPNKITHSDLVVEGIFMEFDIMDGSYVHLNVLPGWTGPSGIGILPISVENDQHYKMAQKLSSGDRLRVEYNMVQAWSFHAGECLVGAVATKMQKAQ